MFFNSLTEIKLKTIEIKKNIGTNNLNKYQEVSPTDKSVQTAVNSVWNICQEKYCSD